MIEDNRKVAESFFVALNAHDLDALDRLRAADFQSDATPGRMDIELNRRYIENLISGFPDLRFKINLTVAQGDYVVVDWAAEGTHQGVFHTPSGASIAPTGGAAKMVGSHTFELKNGKITRSWFFTDMASLLAQLGLIPPI